MTVIAVFFLTMLGAVAVGTGGFPDWQLFDGSGYCYLDPQMTWEEAVNAYVSFGGRLVAPNSQRKLDFMWNIIIRRKWPL